MEEQSQFETLNHSSISLFPLSPHRIRRRHLNSETLSTLLRVLSRCYQPNHQVIVSEQPKEGNGENELGQLAEPEVPGKPVVPTGMECEILVIERDGQCAKGFGIDKCVNEDRMEIDEFEDINRINEEPFGDNCIKLGSKLDEKNPSGNVISLIDNQEGQCSLRGICMGESGNMRQVVIDKDCHNCNVTEVLDLSLDIDIIAEPPKLVENNVEGSAFEDTLREAGHGATNSPLCVTIDDEIEEGEISGDLGLYDQSIDLLLEDAISLEKKNMDEERISETITTEEQLTCTKQKGTNQESNKANKKFEETIDNVGNGVELKLKGSNISEMEYKCEMVVCGDNGEAKMAHGYDFVPETGRNDKQATRANEEFSGLAVSNKISGQIASENQCTLSTEEDAGVDRKQKMGPLTKEKKAKKKHKKRIKRAEENSRLGVKRLKIQPVLKPKTVLYCRHYLRGRCQEGEKCKFSHDTIPSTKSKPCCHFAQHSCMKGDDCPFDHQLSNYPCNKYLSKGYCSRGTKCMFSHELSPKEGSPSTINVSKPQLESSSLLRGANSGKQSNFNSSSHQKADSKPGSILVSSCKNSQHHVAETILKPAAQTPRGINNFLFGKSSLGNPTKLNQDGCSSLKSDGGVKVGLPISHGTPNLAQNINESTKMTSAVESKGINFLSFGKAPLHDSSSKKPSSLRFSTDYGFKKSTFGDNGLKVVNQIGQNARDMEQNLSEMPQRTAAVAPRGINFLSFSKAPLDNASNMKLADVPANGDNDVGSLVQERERAAKIQIPSAKSWRLLSSSLPSDQSLNQLADLHGKDVPSSSLRALLSNTPNSAHKAHISTKPNSAQKALQSTLAFAANYESRIKTGHPAVSADFNEESSSSQNAMRESTILDFLYNNGTKTKP